MQDQKDWQERGRPIPGSEDDPNSRDIPDDAMDNVVYRKGNDIGQKGGETRWDRKVDEGGAYYDLDEPETEAADDIMDSDNDE